MAFPTPSIGDILMLSQLAWKIGCAFTAGRAGAPAEFQEVENELKSLTTAITLLAETLDEDGSLLARADDKTREGLDKILSCCRQTLDVLDSFVNQYQEIKRPDEAGGLATQRSWKSILVRNYKKVVWTTEGGGIQSLRNMLAMHTQSISLTMQALQSRSLSRLEKVIEPVADQIDEMHNKLNGDLDLKIDEIHHVMLSLRATVEQSSPMIWPAMRMENAASVSSYGSPSISPRMKPKRAPTYTSIAEPMERKPSYVELKERQSSYTSAKYPQTPQKTPELSDSEFSFHSPLSSARTSGQQTFDHKESVLIPPEHQYRLSEAPPEYERNRRVSNNSEGVLYSPKSINIRRQSEYQKPLPEPISPSMLPPPAIPSDIDYNFSRPSSQDYTATSRISESTILPPATCTVEEQDIFERKLFTDATVLCEVRSTLVDYTQPDTTKPGEWKMIEACRDCKVCLVTKSHKLSNGSLRFMTSLWAISDNRGTRLQQKMIDGEEIIPYTVWGNEKKVVLRVPTELKFHDTTMDAKPVSVAKTSWINFNFENERAASSFQSALIGKLLLLSVQTKRTMRIHDGITGTFTFAEQLCGLENLRVFQDEQTGGVLAMIHYTPQFHDGYLAFHLNSTQNPVRIRDEDEKTIKIKGLSVVVDDKNSLTRRDSTATGKNAKQKGGEKIIRSVKVEFYTPDDKMHFKNLFKEIQGGQERFV